MYAPHSPRRRASLQPHRSWRRRLGLLILIVFGFGISGSAGAGIYFLPALTAAFHDLGQAPQGTIKTAKASPGGTSAPTPESTAQLTPSSAPPPNAPFTVLLLGSDTDAKFEGAYLTQSMILVRVNPVTKKVVMLSIARDLYVELCNGSYDKIDQAYLDGGLKCTITTIENDFGVNIDYYAWIGLQGLVTVINDVNDVDVVASNPVMDDYYPADLNGGNPYLYERVLVMPGPQQMSGTIALDYVRSRHDDVNGDFGRSIRQQQVLIALKANAHTLNLADLPSVASAMSQYFSTDMTINDITSLLPIAGSVPLSSITQIVLLTPYTTGGTVGNQSVEFPNWAYIDPKVSEYFPSN